MKNLQDNEKNPEKEKVSWFVGCVFAFLAGLCVYIASGNFFYDLATTFSLVCIGNFMASAKSSTVIIIKSNGLEKPTVVKLSASE